MAASRMPLTVESEDGSTTDCVVDQRDMAAFEQQFKMGFQTGIEELTFTATRFVAYLALKRTEVIDPKTTFEAWSKYTVEVAPTEQEDEDGPAVPLDTSASGQPEVSAEA
jgi:hypothetical protein